MKAVGIRELKNRLSEFLREVKEGERVLITDRGKVVAELRSADEAALESLLDPGLVQLAKRGLLAPGAPNRADLYPRFGRLLARGRLAELLNEEREER